MSVRLLDGQGKQLKRAKGGVAGEIQRNERMAQRNRTNKLTTKDTDLRCYGTACEPDDITDSKLQLLVNPITHVRVIWGRFLPRISLKLKEPAIRPPRIYVSRSQFNTLL